VHRARAAGGLALSVLRSVFRAFVRAFVSRASVSRATVTFVSASLIAVSLVAAPSTASSAARPISAEVSAPTDADVVTLTRVTPAVAGPGQDVSIAGVLDVAALGIDLSAAQPTLPSTPTAHPGTADDTGAAPPALEPVASVDVRLGPAGVTSHDEVSDWADGQTPASGPLLGTTDLVTAPDPTVDRLPFAVTVAGLEDHVRTAYGVVAVSVEVRLPGQSEPAAVQHTFLGFQERKEYEALQLSWIVPFTLPADPVLLGAFGEERTNAWEALVGPDGSLSERLAAASGPDTVWVIDPALLTPGPAPAPEGEAPEPTGTEGQDGGSGGDAARSSGTAASTGNGAGTTEPDTTATDDGSGDGSGDGDTESEEPEAPETGPLTQAETEHLLRAEFAQALLAAVDGRGVLVLPAHDADIAALPTAEESGSGPGARRDIIATQIATEQAVALLAEHGARPQPTLWPADGAWGADRDADVRALPGGDVDWSVLTTPSSLSSTVRGPVPSSTGTFVLPVNDALSVRMSSGSGSALETGLALMADTLVTLNDRPGTVRHAILVPDRDSPWLGATTELMTLLAGVPWIDLTGLPSPGTLAGSRPVGFVDNAAPLIGADTATDAATAPAVLDDARAGALRTTLDLLPTAASVRAGSDTGSGVDLSTRGADSLAQLASTRWRGHEEDWQSAYQPLADTVASTFTGLHIPSRDVTFLADTGLLRVTVENSLDAPIAGATLDLVVDHPILRIEDGPQPVEVGADSRTTVGFQASSIATGKVEITATLRAPDGTVLAEPTTFSVRVSPTSDWIYWVLLALAGGIILIGIIRTVLRRRPST